MTNLMFLVQPNYPKEAVHDLTYHNTNFKMKMPYLKPNFMIPFETCWLDSSFFLTYLLLQYLQDPPINFVNASHI